MRTTACYYSVPPQCYTAPAGSHAQMSSQEQVKIAARLARDNVPVEQICTVLKISRRSCFRYMSRRAAEAAT